MKFFARGAIQDKPSTECFNSLCVEMRMAEKHVKRFWGLRGHRIVSRVCFFRQPVLNYCRALNAWRNRAAAVDAPCEKA